ncbi:hypothetical protein [Actinoalloteichus caeruleus]|uniref:hypothetical protein n=1 Tax=Actinoalloteichus cyanogriseus TaxID=2893586 RepID=UPI0009DDAB81|nr:hypothetical protein [Actinoalloteichus caeruleus]
MTHDTENFHDAFSSFVRKSGRWRDVEPEALFSQWRTFVEECEQGYRGDAEDYFNDLTSRDCLANALNSAELQKFPELALLSAEVEAVDSRFRALLFPDAFPRMPEEVWWARGVVKFAGRRLVEDLRREYRVEPELVE